MAPRKTLTVGDFSKGIVADIIGASDSMLDIKDGWVPRVGEIRKRGGKPQYIDTSSITSRNWRAGAKSTELGSGSLNPDGTTYVDREKSHGFAFVGDGRWMVYRSGDANPISLQNSRPLTWYPPDGSPKSVFFGGGDQITNFGSILVSTGYAAEDGDIRMVGKWGGAVDNVFATATGIRLVTGSNVGTLESPAAGSPGSFVPNNFPPGAFFTIDKATPTQPNQKIVFMVVAASTKNVWFDRPWPGPTGNDYIFEPKVAIDQLDDPLDVGANAGKVIEAHQDRLFLANFDPEYQRNDTTFVGFGTDVEERRRHQSRVRWSALWSENGTDVPGGPTATVDTHLCAYGENLWYPNAFFDVFPGQGGAITGLHSIGNELVVVKEDGVYSLRGTFSSKGSPSGLSADVIQLENGTPSFRGSTKTEIGVVWANSRGLWVYNGGQTVNLVDNVIDSVWAQYESDFSDVVVSGCNERIIVQFPDSTHTWVYHTDKGYFARQDTNDCTNVIAFGDKYFGNVELAVDNQTKNIIDWAGDFTESLADDEENSSFPRMIIQTQALPAGEQPFYSGRPNLLLVAGIFSGDMEASITFGRRDTFAGYNELEDQVPPDDTQPLEYGIEALAGREQISRIPIGGVASRQAHQFTFTQTASASRMRMYGIGVEYIEDYTVDND